MYQDSASGPPQPIFGSCCVSRIWRAGRRPRPAEIVAWVARACMRSGIVVVSTTTPRRRTRDPRCEHARARARRRRSDKDPIFIEQHTVRDMPAREMIVALLQGEGWCEETAVLMTIPTPKPPAPLSPDRRGKASSLDMIRERQPELDPKGDCDRGARLDRRG